MTPPAVRQVGDAVVIQGSSTLQDLANWVLTRISRGRSNGVPTEVYVQWLATIHAAMSAPRHELPEIVSEAGELECQDGDDWISTAEAAAILAISGRQVQRLAPQLRGRRVGAAWVLLKAPVLALAEERKRKARNGERQS